MSTHRLLGEIRREPGIGTEISEYIPSLKDRYQIVQRKNRGDGFLVFPEDKSKLCLPTDVFRTNPGPDGCTPFAVREGPAGRCCVQSDLDFCSSVSAIIRGKDNFQPSGRILTEMYRWLSTVRADLLPDDKEVFIDITTNNGKHLLELAVQMATDVNINMVLHQPDQTLPGIIADLRGTVRVYAGANGVTLNFSSLENIISSGTSLRNLNIECPVKFAVGDDEEHVVDLVSAVHGFHPGTDFQFSFALPPTIPVRSVGEGLLDIIHWETAPNGPIRTMDGETLTVTFNESQNRIFVHLDGFHFIDNEDTIIN